MSETKGGGPLNEVLEFINAQIKMSGMTSNGISRNTVVNFETELRPNKIYIHIYQGEKRMKSRTTDS